jgi:hypothetical protein
MREGPMFKGAIISGSDTTFAAFRGTRTGGVLGIAADWFENVTSQTLGIGGSLGEMQAVDFLAKANAKYSDLQCTGHSKGGGECLLAGNVVGVGGIVFNARPVGLIDAFANNVAGASSEMRHFRANLDVVSRLPGFNPGVASPTGYEVNSLNPLDHHGMESVPYNSQDELTPAEGTPFHLGRN